MKTLVWIGKLEFSALEQLFENCNKLRQTIYSLFDLQRSNVSTHCSGFHLSNIHIKILINK